MRMDGAKPERSADLAAAVLALDPANRARTGAHHHAVSRDHPARTMLDAFQQRPVGNAGCGEDRVALHQVLKPIDTVEIGHAPFLRACALLVIAEKKPAFELAADAGQR